MALESKSLMSQNSTESTVVVVGQTTFMLYEYVNPRAYKVGGWGWVDATPHTVFLEFFQDELLSTSTVFSSCAHIP